MLPWLALACELVAFLCFVYGIAAACEGEVGLGRLQLRGRGAVLGGLAIAAAGLATVYLVAWCKGSFGP